jgi:hypothetical protein
MGGHGRTLRSKAEKIGANYIIVVQLALVYYDKALVYRRVPKDLDHAGHPVILVVPVCW